MISSGPNDVFTQDFPIVEDESLKQVASNYANLIATAINYCDVQKFHEKIAKFCIPMVKVIRRVSSSVPGNCSFSVHAANSFMYPYQQQQQQSIPSTISPVASSTPASLLSTEHYGIDQFCAIMSDFHRVGPDGVMEVYEHRCCYQGGDFSVYVSSYRYTGTLLIQQSPPALPLLGPTVDYTLAQMCLQGATRPLTAAGTMMSYVLSNGYVYCVEFIYEYI